jgi:type I restriction enzyme S subunit
MKSSYKALATYIEPVNQLNDGMEVNELLGISNQKFFQNSHTNTIGIDLQTYRIVRTNQFAYNRATTRNGDKISIALRQGNDCIVSPSYRIFRSKDENALNSEYLMMWFRRPEFDRYARFKSHGSAHEFFEYDQMCQVELPIPHIDKQREIVKEYNVIQNRLALNQQLIQKLEETAQAIYKSWFADYEFPDENEKPYKSNGGEMVWNEELQKEIPKGWEDRFLSEFVVLSQGIQVDVEDQLLEKGEGMNRFLRIIDYTPNTEEAPRFVNLNDERYYCSSDEIAMIRYGDAGTVCRRFEGIIANNLFKISPLNGLTNNFLYYFLKDSENQKKIRTSDLAVAMPAITHNTIKELPIVYPQNAEKLIIDFDNYTQLIENNILLKIKEIENLKSLSNLMLSKLATIEN